MNTSVRRFQFAVAIAVAAALSVHTARAAMPSAEQIRDAAGRAVAALQSTQTIWDSKRSCASCHHHFQPALAFRVAREHGIAVDEKAALAVTRHSFDFTDLEAAIDEPRLDAAGVNAYRLVAADAAGMQRNVAASLEVRVLLSLQNADGHWTGRGERPPSSHSVFTRTALAIKALQLYHHPADAAQAAIAVTRARNWLANHSAPDTEGRVYRLLGLMWAGADSDLRERLARELESQQHQDGGWSSVEGRDSEAYSTAQTLFALHESADVATSNQNWTRGIEFLVRTETAGGTWHVPSRLHDPGRLSPPYFESGYPYRHDQFISAAGAAWAVMALSDVLPRVSAALTPSFPLDLLPPSTQPWVETILFGTEADVAKLLSRGFDPASAKSPGETTPLMMAAPDAHKMRILIQHGANVNARSRTGYTALAVASHYGHADDAITLLLDAGARVKMPVGPDAADVQVLGIAAHSGNAHVLRRLLEAGGDLYAPVSFRDVRVTPILIAVADGDSPVVKALLDLGLRVNNTKAEPWSGLEFAVMNNNLTLARLLLDRGANVNLVDAAGYTPLLLAASIDFGDSAMLRLLLASGANTAARNKNGETALDLARKYGHTRFIEPLQIRAVSQVQ